MGKAEFLAVLRGQMTGRIPTGEVNSQLEYYSAYIDSQVAKGIREEEVVEELGDPRLIAKTLIESTNRAAEAAGYDGPYRKSTDSYDDSDGINTGEFGRSSSGDYSQYSDNFSGQKEDGYSGSSEKRFNGSFAKSSKFGCGGFFVVAIVVLLIILALLVFLVGFSFRFIGIILPIAVVVIGIGFLVKYLGRR